METDFELGPPSASLIAGIKACAIKSGFDLLLLKKIVHY